MLQIEISPQIHREYAPVASKRKPKILRLNWIMEILPNITYHIHGSDSLPLGVFSVGDGVPDHIFQEHFEDAPRLLVDQPGDPFHAAPTRQTADGRLGNALNVVTQHLKPK